MISDALLLYLTFQMILLMFNILGYSRISMMFFFAIIGSLILAIPTIQAFGDYYPMAILLIIVNISLPAIGLSRLK
jgi:hypothetical protein